MFCCCCHITLRYTTSHIIISWSIAAFVGRISLFDCFVFYASSLLLFFLNLKKKDLIDLFLGYFVALKLVFSFKSSYIKTEQTCMIVDLYYVMF